MARINLNQIEKVKNSFDIVELASKHTKLTWNGEQYIGKCPFCNDKEKSLAVSKKLQLFYCFNCRRSGSSINFYREAGDYFCSMSTVAQIMAQEANIDLEE